MNDREFSDVFGVPALSESTSGADLLDQVESFIRRFCVLPGEHCYPAVALWAAHTHFIDRLETTPRLACLSPEPGSGKTRVLEVLDLLCRNPLLTLDVSMAAFFRIVEDRQPSFLIDEVDAIFTGKEKSESTEDMRRVINNGYRVGAVVQRVGGRNRDEVQDFHVFTPVAMAGIGRLPDTLMTRSVIIRMKRRAAGEHIEPFRDRLHRPEGEKLAALVGQWSALYGGFPGYPELPDGVADRDADVWEPLLMVADAAGGDWPDRARDACLKFLDEKPESSVSIGVRLLNDLRTVWTGHAMSTADVLAALKSIEEAPWADLYGEGLKPRKLAQLLGDYGIRSGKIRVGGVTRQGYRQEDLWDSWERYTILSPESGTSGTGGTSGAAERDGAAPDVPLGPTANGTSGARSGAGIGGTVPRVPDVPESGEENAACTADGDHSRCDRGNCHVFASCVLDGADRG